MKKQEAQLEIIKLSLNRLSEISSRIFEEDPSVIIQPLADRYVELSNSLKKDGNSILEDDLLSLSQNIDQAYQTVLTSQGYANYIDRFAKLKIQILEKITDDEEQNEREHIAYFEQVTKLIAELKTEHSNPMLHSLRASLFELKQILGCPNALLAFLQSPELHSALGQQANILQNGSLVEPYAIGDIHAHLNTLIQAVTQMAQEDPNGQFPRIFLGDIIDRGPTSLETIVLLLLLIKNNPGIFYLLRGNHEDAYAKRIDITTTNFFDVCGFHYLNIDECRFPFHIPRSPTLHRRFSEKEELIGLIEQAFREIFLALPLKADAVIADDKRKWLLVHGGVSNLEIKDTGIVFEDFDTRAAPVTWNDFAFEPYKLRYRGLGIPFGPETLRELQKVGYNGMVCGHLHTDPILGDHTGFESHKLDRQAVRRYITFLYSSEITPHLGKLTENGWRDIAVQVELRSWPEELQDAFLSANTKEEMLYMLSGLLHDMLTQCKRAYLTGGLELSDYANKNEDKCRLVLLIFMHCFFEKSFVSQENITVRQFFSPEFLSKLATDSIRFLLYSFEFHNPTPISNLKECRIELTKYFESLIGKVANVEAKDLRGQIKDPKLAKLEAYEEFWKNLATRFNSFGLKYTPAFYFQKNPLEDPELQSLKIWIEQNRSSDTQIKKLQDILNIGKNKFAPGSICWKLFEDCSELLNNFLGQTPESGNTHYLTA